MSKKTLDIQTKRLHSSYENIGNAVINFSLQLYRVYSDRYYTKANDKPGIKKDWEKYLSQNLASISLKQGFT